MGLNTAKLRDVDALLTPLLRQARIPGVAIAVVIGEELVYAKGFGSRNLAQNAPMTPDTLYPIASTTKSINATLLAMLVDDGLIQWDTPVRRYLPHFALRDEMASARATLRDLVTMRTGLPRHDWVWIANPGSRAQLLERLAHLDLSTDFRRRFQYCNLSVVAAGHVAEIVTGRSWEELVKQRILQPLEMRRTAVAVSGGRNATSSYHEDARRQLRPSKRLQSGITAPSGGSIHSTVRDMAKWLSFNLNGGVYRRRRLISRRALSELHAPQVVIGDRPLAGLPAEASYALGWIYNVYRGRKCLSHGGYLHDVNSSIMLFPESNVGLVSFINFGPPALAELINQHVFGLMSGDVPPQTFEEKLALYQKQIDTIRKRNARLVPVKGTRPAHPARMHAGTYEHPGYGEVRIRARDRQLWLHRYGFHVRLKHWHYDAWVAAGDSMWPIHQPHAFDRASQIRFHTGADGAVTGLSIALEPELPPVLFQRRRTGSDPR